MNKPQPVRLNSGDPDLLNRIEKLRGRLLNDEGIRSRISQRAYELYEQRGGDPGRDVEDWLLAENEILSPLIEEAMSRQAATGQSQKSQALRMSRQTAAPKTSGVRKTTKLSPGKESSSQPKETVPAPKRESSKTASRRGRKKKLESEPDRGPVTPLGGES